MKLLRLTPTLKATTTAYNQFSLGFKDKIIVKNDLRITEKLCQSIVSLPIYPELESKMALKVIKELKNFDVERI